MFRRCFCRFRLPICIKFTLQVLMLLLSLIVVCYAVSFLIANMYTLIILAILVGAIALIQFFYCGLK
ncbi:MAG: hypothetical protein Q8873_07875 [Bacillota bacterium]|nr:hypothetical protein [Bacillota bacterium]